MSSTELNVRVIPNASRDAIVGWHAGALKIKTAVAPESGKVAVRPSDDANTAEGSTSTSIDN